MPCPGRSKRRPCNSQDRRLVYDLYGLTEDDIRIVEKSIR